MSSLEEVHSQPKETTVMDAKDYSGYQYFKAARREDFEKEHPNTNPDFKEFSKECLSMWNSLQREEKDKYVGIAEEDDELYMGEPSSEIEKDNEEEGRKDKRKYASVYEYFFQYSKKETMKWGNPLTGPQSMRHFAKECSERWKYMKPEEKLVYARKMEAAHEGGGDTSSSDVENDNDEKTLSTKGLMLSYTFFVQHCREESQKGDNPQDLKPFSQFSKECAEKWKKMTEEEKKVFADLATEDIRKFQNEK